MSLQGQAPVLSPPIAIPSGAAVTEGGHQGAIVLENNVLRGTARLTNTQPKVLAILAESPWRYDAGVNASSTSPGGYSASAQTIKYISPTQFSFEMLAEAGAGGSAGVTYNVAARLGNVYFPTQTGVKLRPYKDQPEPTDVSFNACAGVIEFEFGTDDTCEERSDKFLGASFPGLGIYRLPSSDIYRAIYPGGASATTTVYYSFRGKDRLGRDVNLLARRYVSWSVGCDEVVRRCIPVEDAIAAPEGDFTGPFEIIGEPVTAQSLVYAEHTGWPLARADYVNRDAPESDPGSWWKLLRASEGKWWMLGRGYVRKGRDFTYLQAPVLQDDSQYGSIPVVVDEMTPVTRLVDGEVRHAFSMHPASFYGNIRLADPSVLRASDPWSTLQTLYFETDRDGNKDGVPDYPYGVNSGSHVRAAGDANGFSMTTFPGSFDPALGELVSRYKQVLPNPFDLPASWHQQYLSLVFWSEPTGYTRPGLYEPTRFRNGGLGHSQRASTWVRMAPEAAKNVDHEYCYNEVQLQYVPSVGMLFNPSVQVEGSFKGVDWLGRPADYTVSGGFGGIPAIIGGNIIADGVLHKQKKGTISMALPQGKYTLTPGAYLVSDTNAVSSAVFAPLTDVTLGCGNRVVIVPPLAVGLSAPAACASGPTQTVSGKVSSGLALVDKIWYQVNGGEAVTLCNNCGSNPTFSFSAALKDCANDIKVFAFSEGMTEPATAAISLVWDDPEDGPSCSDSTCINRAPLARCRDITVRTGEACSGCGSVNDGSHDPDPGDSVTCVQTPDCPYSVGANAVRLTCTDSRGLSASCEATVTVKDESPPALVCPSEVPVLECRDGGAPLSYETSALDNCGAVTTTCYPASGSVFPPGSTDAVCTATDASGNRTRCSFPVTVEDHEPPTIVCPESFTSECNDGRGKATFPAAPVEANDSCQPPEIEGPLSFPVDSTTTVTYTAKDAGGNRASCSTSVSVVDTQPPVLTLFGDSPLSLVCGQPYEDPGLKARDACYGSLTSTVVTSGSVNPWKTGTYVITYSVKDPAGHSATASREVRVVARTVTPGPASGWASAASTSAVQQRHTATRMLDGKVLVLGGYWPLSAAVYDPVLDSWSNTEDLPSTYRDHTATLLSDGRVLVVGGANGGASTSVMLYDPLGGWSAASGLAAGRVEHTATRLANGKVLVTGGTAAAAPSELFAPEGNTWTTTGTPLAVRAHHTATLMPDGRVLVIGGRDPSGNPLNTAEIYDPITGLWSATATMSLPRSLHTATLLPTGRILVAGGARGTGASTAELYDPVTNTWSPVGNMNSPRGSHTATLLPSGRVLVAGGYDESTGILSKAEVYDPCDGSWTPVSPMGVSRFEHTATVLEGGQILVVAGRSYGDQKFVERFNPDGL